jgi:hypothetical protein
MSGQPPGDCREVSGQCPVECPEEIVARIRVEAVRVNQGRDGVSPVVASIYCSLHPAALQIDPPPGSGNFASMIPRPEN